MIRLRFLRPPFALFCGLLGLLAGSVQLSAQIVHNIWDPPFLQGIACEVEDQIITFEDLRREMAPLIPRIRESTRTRKDFNDKMENLYREVLQNLVDRVLIVAEFNKKEFNIPQSYVENEFDRMLKEDFDGDRAKMHEYLSSQGKNIREFRRDLRERIIVSVMRGEKRRSLSQVSPERIARFYDEHKLEFYEDESVKLRIIMLKPMADENTDLMRQHIDKVMAELDSGRPFAQVATEFSQDSRKDRGGDWGWIKRPDLKDELSAVAFNLKKGEHSQPIYVDRQIFILYAEDFQDEGIQPLSEVRGRIEEILGNQLIKQTQRQWLERLRKNGYVRYY